MSTLDTLWDKLGLDSLPEDTGQPNDFGATRTRDWRADTLKVFRPELVAVTERLDLPRLSISPPALLSAPNRPDNHQDLVIVGVLGEGGMGRVLLARQQSIGREVAVKVPRAESSNGAVQALVHEARTTGGLEHPGVIPVYALASDASGLPALVMKRVDGVSWHVLVHDPEDPAWAKVGAGADRLLKHVEILIQVCNAVGFAHSRGVLHRDIKPANVLIGEFGEVFVADWGVAIRKSEARETNSLVGTPAYLAPEMVMGDDAQMDERSDVFLLGGTLCEVLTGQPPHHGAHLHAVLRSAWECLPPQLPGTVPGELANICRKAMARRPSERYQTAIELRDALMAWVRHRGSVELERASRARLETLLALLEGGSKDRSTIYPLLSECRFGFTQALREWVDNLGAVDGLRQSQLVAARFEVAIGNAQAARALLNELGEVPAELEAAVRHLEAEEVSLRTQQARLKHLSKEMDPRVAMRQRVFFLLGLGVSASLIVGSQVVSPQVRAALKGLGPWYLTALMGTAFTVFLCGLWLGRKSLLATRLNRRVAGLVGLTFVGPLANRVLAVQTQALPPQTMVSDLLLSAAVCATGGFLLHWGFFLGAGWFALGGVAATFFPQFGSPIYGVSAVLAIGSLAFSWRRWRNELWTGKD